jgi:predicted nucleotidyltransferase
MKPAFWEANPMAATNSNVELDGILAAFRDRMPQWRARFGITDVGVFGSVVRGNDREESDLDVLVDYERAPSLFQLSALQREMSRIAGRNVDLSLRRTLKPAIGKRILAEVVYL